MAELSRREIYYRNIRYNRLKEFLLPGEARELSKQPISTPQARKIFRHIKQDRETIINNLRKEATFNRWTKKQLNKEIREAVKFEYTENGWHRKGKPSVWEMIDAYAKKYCKSPKKSHHPIKGDIDYFEYRQRVNAQRKEQRLRRKSA